MTSHVRCTCNNNIGMFSEVICAEIKALSASGKLPTIIIDNTLTESPVIAVFAKYNIMQKCCRLKIMTFLNFFEARDF